MRRIPHLKRVHINREDLLKIRSELSKDLEGMSSSQRIKYLEAAKQVHDGLLEMRRIRNVPMTY